MSAAPSPADRAALTQASVDAWRDRDFEWGRADCARMIASHIKRFGHRAALSRFGSYSSARGAVAALRRGGCATMGDALCGISSLIALPSAAFARVGDIIEMPAQPEDLIGGAMVIYCGNGTIFGFHPDGGGAGVARAVMQNDVSGMIGGWHV